MSADEHNVLVAGWSVIPETAVKPEEVLVFADGKSIYSGRANDMSVHLQRRFDDRRLRDTGFRFFVPRGLIPDLDGGELRVLGRWADGSFSELSYPRGWAWGPRFSLSRSDSGKEMLESPDGIRLPVTPWSVRGKLTRAAEQEDSLYLTGWAMDEERSRPADTVVAFRDGEFLTSVRPARKRADLVKSHGEELAWSGFDLRVAKVDPSSEIRLFAVSDRGVASEMEYFPGYEWGLNFRLEAGSDDEQVGILGLRMEPGRFRGRVNQGRGQDGRIRVYGWAAVEVEDLEPVAKLLVFVNGDLIYSAAPNVDRKDLVERFGLEALLRSGFGFALPPDLHPGLETEPVRVFAISQRGAAAELPSRR